MHTFPLSCSWLRYPKIKIKSNQNSFEIAQHVLTLSQGQFKIKFFYSVRLRLISILLSARMFAWSLIYVEKVDEQ